MARQPEVRRAAIEESHEQGPTVVGIGASAGGLAALRAFFEHVPENSDLAFVVVVHLSPEHKSHLAELLQPHVRIPVQQVGETVPLEKNRVYVIPPNSNLSTIDTHLRLSELEENRSKRAPIDHFFRTLARTHDGHAIGVILTGTGSDGALGLKEIKEKGGLAIVQDPNEAEYDGMPQSAIATGLVDRVLPIAEIPAAILAFAHTSPRVPIVDEERDLEAEQRRFLQKVFAQMRARTNRDFSRYKRSTILRRIARRMQLCRVEELEEYLEVLRQHPDEVRELADDLLITVTSFFRDPEVWERLAESVIPRIFDGKELDDEIRVWSVGCATGEEAYSLAMLLLEQAEKSAGPPRIQVFASDLHLRSLERAREGFYPGDVEIDVGARRLKRYFTKEAGGYRIRKEVREVVLFTPHNLLADPPFSRLDLVACRNLLIYLQREIQRDVIDLFHYSLRPEGFLLLGPSEAIESSELFWAEDDKRCIFRRRNVVPREPRLPVFPFSRARLGGKHIEDGVEGEPPSSGTLHEQLIELCSLPSLVVGPDDRVVHVSEKAGRFLVHSRGEVTANVLRVVREELRMDLLEALQSARGSAKATRSKPVPITLDDKQREVILHARPATDPQQLGYVLVVFDEIESEPSAGPTRATTRQQDKTRLRELDTELDLARHRFQAIVEEYETSQEEMQAANEELQSTNEELRSTMEELETSKEELQSTNEELQTVNQENRHKVEELAQLTSDLQNLLAATDIATLFLDRDLRILRFTPKVSELFNMRLADRGRPLSDLTHRLGYDNLQRDAQTVLDRLVPIERDVRDQRGRWFLTRILPYRSADDRIEGVVITLVDISTLKAAEESLRRSEERLRWADRRKDEFLATLAHELRDPLAALRNGLALFGVAAVDDESRRELQPMMERQLEQLVRLIDDLVDVSRISQNKLELRTTRVELGAQLRQAMTIAAPVLIERRVELDLPEQPLFLDADPVRISQVFSNLLRNACKFTETGGLIRVAARRQDGEAVITVEDDGVGIPAGDLARIFEMFAQVDSSTEQSRGGMGIGLTLSKQLVEMHGGTIEARSEGSGKGSRFVIRLPAGARGAVAGEEPGEWPAAHHSGHRILVVDDNADAARSLGLLLERRGNEVRTANDGEEALRVASEFLPESILLDLGLPKLDGNQVARRLRQETWGKDVILVAITGRSQPVDRSATSEAGFDAHLVKPVTLGTLEHTLDGLRARRNARAEPG